MSKLSVAEIERHFEDSLPADNVLEFIEPAHDEVLEEPWTPELDGWWFEDYNPYEYDDRYDDPYPHDEDFY